MYNLGILYLSVVLSLISHTEIFGRTQNMLSNVPVADLRTEPTLCTSRLSDSGFNSDYSQETQLLLGEHVIGGEEKNGYIYVEAQEQPEFSEAGGWHHCEGFVKASHLTPVKEFPKENLVVANTMLCPLYATNNDLLTHLSLGTKLIGTEEKNDSWVVRLPHNNQLALVSKKYVKSAKKTRSNSTREEIIRTANLFLDTPYALGGCSGFDETKNTLTGVDCSSLVHLCYRLIGIRTPRNANAQYVGSTKLQSGAELQIGDLAFLAHARNAEKVIHVMIFLGDDQLLDSFGLPPRKTRTFYCKDEFGKTLSEIQTGDKLYGFNTRDYIFYFGSYF